MNEYGYGGVGGKASIASDDYKYNTPQGQVFLEHSCDDWCIGDAENVRLMIADLEGLLATMEEE